MDGVPGVGGVHFLPCVPVLCFPGEAGASGSPGSLAPVSPGEPPKPQLPKSKEPGPRLQALQPKGGGGRGTAALAAGSCVGTPHQPFLMYKRVLLNDQVFKNLFNLNSL